MDDIDRAEEEENQRMRRQRRVRVHGPDELVLGAHDDVSMDTQPKQTAAWEAARAASLSWTDRLHREAVAQPVGEGATTGEALAVEGSPPGVRPPTRY